VSGSWDRTIKLYNLSTREYLSTIQKNTDIRSLAVIDMNSQKPTTTPMNAIKKKLNIFLIFL
jgi:WD40 repeat protein